MAKHLIGNIKGPKGDQGIQGIQGERGEKGEQGIQGVQGIQGEKGDKGDSYILTDTDKATVAASIKDSLPKESWTFTLADGSTVTKDVYVG